MPGLFTTIVESPHSGWNLFCDLMYPPLTQRSGPPLPAGCIHRVEPG